MNDKIYNLYGKLNTKLKTLSLEGLQTSTAKVVVDNERQEIAAEVLKTPKRILIKSIQADGSEKRQQFDGSQEVITDQLVTVDYHDPSKQNLITNSNKLPAALVAESTEKNFISDDQLNKLANIEGGAQVNIIESIKLNGNTLNPSETKEVDLGELATSTELNDVSGRVQTIESDYLKSSDKQDLSSRITTIEDDYLKAIDKSELSSAIEQTKTDLEADINTKVSQVAYDAKVLELDNKITQTATDLNTTISNSISELSTTVDGKLATRDAAITAETNRATTEEQKIAADLADEITRAGNIEAGLRTDVDLKVNQTTYDTKVGELTTEDSRLSGLITTEATTRETADNGLQAQIDAISASTDVKDVVGTKAALNAYDTSTLGDNDIIKVLKDESNNNAMTYYKWAVTSTDPKTHAWQAIGNVGPYYTQAETNTLLNAKADLVDGVVPDYELPDYADILFYHREQNCTKESDFNKILGEMSLGDIWWCTSNREPDPQSEDPDIRAGSIYGQTFFKKIAAEPGFETIQPKTNALYIWVLSSGHNRAKRWTGTSLNLAFGSVINTSRSNAASSQISVGTAYSSTYGVQNYNDIQDLKATSKIIQTISTDTEISKGLFNDLWDNFDKVELNVLQMDYPIPGSESTTKFRPSQKLDVRYEDDDDSVARHRTLIYKSVNQLFVTGISFIRLVETSYKNGEVVYAQDLQGTAIPTGLTTSSGSHTIGLYDENNPEPIGQTIDLDELLHPVSTDEDQKILSTKRFISYGYDTEERPISTDVTNGVQLTFTKYLDKLDDPEARTLNYNIAAADDGLYISATDTSGYNSSFLLPIKDSDEQYTIATTDDITAATDYTEEYMSGTRSASKIKINTNGTLQIGNTVLTEATLIKLLALAENMTEITEE